jgi:hypothetical protein
VLELLKACRLAVLIAGNGGVTRLRCWRAIEERGLYGVL